MSIPRIPLKQADPPSLSDILVTDEAMAAKENWKLVGAVVDFVNDLRERRYYRDPEIPRAAMQIYYVDYWRSQVNNGGFYQYVENSRIYEPQMRPVRDLTRSGLIAMGADRYVGFFDDMLALADANIQPDGKILIEGGQPALEDAFEKMFDRFLEINQSGQYWHTGGLINRLRFLKRKVSDWGKSRPVCLTDHLLDIERAFVLKQPNLKALPRPGLQHALKKLGDANPHFAERKAEAAKARETFIDDNPMYAAARDLCAAAGLTFQQFTAGGSFTLDGVDVNGMGLLTDEGPHAMLMPGSEAVLFPMKPWDELSAAARAEGPDAVFDLYMKHPELNEGSDSYASGERELARIAVAEPIWPVART